MTASTTTLQARSDTPAAPHAAGMPDGLSVALRRAPPAAVGDRLREAVADVWAGNVPPSGMAEVLAAATDARRTLSNAYCRGEGWADSPDEYARIEQSLHQADIDMCLLQYAADRHAGSPAFVPLLLTDQDGGDTPWRIGVDLGGQKYVHTQLERDDVYAAACTCGMARRVLAGGEMRAVYSDADEWLFQRVEADGGRWALVANDSPRGWRELRGAPHPAAAVDPDAISQDSGADGNRVPKMGGF
jgi:hypothetical protein